MTFPGTDDQLAGLLAFSVVPVTAIGALIGWVWAFGLVAAALLTAAAAIAISTARARAAMRRFVRRRLPRSSNRPRAAASTTATALAGDRR